MKDHITEDHGSYVAFHYGVQASFIALRADNGSQWRLNRTHVTGHATMELEFIASFDHIQDVVVAVGEQVQKIMLRRLGADAS